MYSSTSAAAGFPSAHQPVTRSRTLLFLSYRDSRAPISSSSASVYPPPRIDKGKGRAGQNGYAKASGGKGVGEEGERLLNGNEADEVRLEMDQANDGLPPRWVDYSDQVELLLEAIKPKMSQLDRLTAKHVLPGFTDRSAEEREIELLTLDITKDFRKCQSHIRKIADYSKYMRSVISGPPKPRTRTKTGEVGGREREERFSERDVVMAVNVQIALATKVQDLSAIFRKRQSNYLKQLKGYEVQTADILAASGAGPIKEDPLAALEADESLSRSSLSNTNTITSPSQQQQSQLMSRTSSLQHSNLEDIQQRDREITGIATSITELSDLFKDLGHLVIDQGTLLDRIDYNVERMSEHVQGAVEELKVATHYQRRSGKCRTIFLLILLIFGAIIILIYKPHRSSSPSSSPSLTPSSPVREPLPVAAGRAGEEPQTVGSGTEVDERTAKRLALGRGVGAGTGDAHAQRVLGGRNLETPKRRRRRRLERWS